MAYCLGGSRSIHLSYGDEIYIVLFNNNLALFSLDCTSRSVLGGVHVEPVFTVFPSVPRLPDQPVT